MASYTMQLSDLVEEYTIGHYHENTRDKIEIARKKLFDFPYPIFDEQYKNVLETHFIRNFFMREIGTETDALFKFNLETWLIINMPYYNKLFESELIKFDPLLNTKVDVTSNTKNDKKQNDLRDGLQNVTANEKNNVTQNQTGNTKGTSQSDGTQESTTNETELVNADGTRVNDDFNRKINSQTPDQRLALTANDGEGVIEFASSIDEENENNKETTTSKKDGSKQSVSDSQSSETTNSNVDSINKSTGDSTTDAKTQNVTSDKLVSNINDIEDYIEHRTGKVGNETYSEMMMKYRQSLIRIEKMMFDEMQQLFMLVY